MLKITCSFAIKSISQKQECPIKITSSDLPVALMELSISRWNQRNNIDPTASSAGYGDTNVNVVKNHFFSESNEWLFEAYKYDKERVATSSGIGLTDFYFNTVNK